MPLYKFLTNKDNKDIFMEEIRSGYVKILSLFVSLKVRFVFLSGNICCILARGIQLRRLVIFGKSSLSYFGLVHFIHLRKTNETPNKKFLLILQLLSSSICREILQTLGNIIKLFHYSYSSRADCKIMRLFFPSANVANHPLALFFHARCPSANVLLLLHCYRKTRMLW